MSQSETGLLIAGRIGPKAVLQLQAGLGKVGLPPLTERIFADAGVTAWLADPPSAMVEEERVARLHQAVRASSTATEAAVLLGEAGRLTADYLLANRIPRRARLALAFLPAPVAARCLLAAITAHAWTFAGSGVFRYQTGLPLVLEIAGNPFCVGEVACAPVCAWHEAVFESLFQALVSSRTRVREVACEARGDACCRFVVDWR